MYIFIFFSELTLILMLTFFFATADKQLGGSRQLWGRLCLQALPSMTVIHATTIAVTVRRTHADKTEGFFSGDMTDRHANAHRDLKPARTITCGRETISDKVSDEETDQQT